MPNNRSNSEIFDAYAKLAIEKGLIKRAEKDEPKESKELKKYRNTTNPRVGSDTLEAITKLYNTKPEAPKSQQYKDNIMEVAHPEKVILTPSYDKLNSLIENNIERQRVMINITQKPVNGLLTQHKYAQSDLAQTLIAVATDLDNRDIVPLRKLADECIDELHKKADFWDSIKRFFKERGEDTVDVGEGGLGGGTIGAVAGGILGAFAGPEAILPSAWLGAQVGGVLGSLISAVTNTSPQAKNVSINAKIAADKLFDLMKDFPQDAFLKQLYMATMNIHIIADQYATLVDEMHLHNDDPTAKRSAANIATKYQVQIEALDKQIKTFLQNAEEGRYASEENDVWSKVKEPFEAVFGFGETLKDAVQAFEALERVNEVALEGIKVTQREAQNAIQATPPATNWVEKDEPGKETTAKPPSDIDLDVVQKMLAKMKDEL